MDQRQLAQLEHLGFTRIHTAPGFSGLRLWWKRTGTALDIVRQHDGATKHQDLGDGHPALPENTPAQNRQWAIELSADELTEWQRGPHTDTGRDQTILQ